MGKISKAVTEEQVQERKDDIISSCYKVYLEKGFKETTLKLISEHLSFARSSIYNYYETKEEIFLDLLTREYNSLNDDLTKIIISESKEKKEISHAISTAFSRRETLIKIISTSLNELEKNSRLEILVDFKKAYGQTLALLGQIFKTHTDLSAEKIETFLELFFPFLFGLSVYTIVSKKQKEAMKLAGLKFVERNIYELCNDFITNYLNYN